METWEGRKTETFEDVQTEPWLWLKVVFVNLCGG